eukprot:8009437-Alexandrium_andersonii.AAC.1
MTLLTRGCASSARKRKARRGWFGLGGNPRASAMASVAPGLRLSSTIRCSSSASPSECSQAI